jgi:hypothetical protein
MERVSERVATRTSADTVNEKAVTNEALDTMLWLSGVKKKSDVTEADSATGFQGKYSPLDDIRDTFKTGNPASTAPEVKVAPTPGQGFTTGGTSGTGTAVEPRAPNVTVDPADVREPAPKFDLGNALKTIATKALPRIAGGALGAIVDPTSTASPDDDEMSRGKAAFLSQPKGTITNPERQATQSNNIQQPVTYSPDMTTPDRMRDLAGIGKK